MTFALLHGKGHSKGRLTCISELERIREAIPVLFAVDFAAGAFEEMNYLYCEQIRDGTRGRMGLRADGVKRPTFSRISLDPDGARGPRWEFPTVILMRHDSVIALSRIIPRLLGGFEIILDLPDQSVGE